MGPRIHETEVRGSGRRASRELACVMGTSEVKRQLIVLQGVGPFWRF